MKFEQENLQSILINDNEVAINKRLDEKVECYKKCFIYITMKQTALDIIPSKIVICKRRMDTMDIII